MGRRKKKAPLRSDFTDALNEEIEERKIVERAQPKEAITENVAVVTEKVSLEKIPVAQVEKVTETPAPQIVEVEIDKKLEARILKEADNTFFEEKTPEKQSAEIPPEKPQKKSIYRSKAMQRWETKREEEKTPPKVEPAPPVEKPRKMSNAEKFGFIAATAMLIYAFVTMDKPLFFLSLSLFVHFLSPLVGGMFGKHSAAAQNALRTFSLVLFGGAILFLFI